jgi:hypothetical protein
MYYTVVFNRDTVRFSAIMKSPEWCFRSTHFRGVSGAGGAQNLYISLRLVRFIACISLRLRGWGWRENFKVGEGELSEGGVLQVSGEESLIGP